MNRFSATETNEQRPNRREMVRSGLRYLALGGIAVFSAGLLLRDALAPGANRCRRSPCCRGCAVLADCRLPQAATARQGNHG